MHPAYARRGVGRALLDHAALHGRASALTPTTFEQVPWNAPYDRRCGFRVLAEHEAQLGLDRWPRVVVQRDAPVT